MKARVKPNARRMQVLSTIIATAVALTMLLPVQPTAYADPITNIPTGVTGRILTKSMAGDTSEWIEIAQNGDYSLLLRRDVLPIGQVHFDSRSIDAYQVSYVRDMVNNWYKNTLPSTARMREFAVKSNPLQEIGYLGVTSNGYSKPTTTAAPTGDDVAFLLSFSEAAMFCSGQYVTDYVGMKWTTSPPVARANLALLNQPSNKPLDDFWWLRSGGNNSYTVKNACSVGSHTGSLHDCVYMSSSQATYPYVRPAIWVNSDIFDEKGTVNIEYLDAKTLEPVSSSESHEVTVGNYGPYPPKDIRFYQTGVLAPDSDPAEGTIRDKEVKNITYLYTRGSAAVIVIHLDLANNNMIGMDTHTIPAGEYGPYGPKDFDGYAEGELLSISDPISGEADIGQTVTIYYGYQRATITVNIIHKTPTNILWTETFTLPVGDYGPYYPFVFPGYKPGVWDTSSDEPSGTIDEIGTVINVVFIYEPL